LLLRGIDSLEFGLEIDRYELAMEPFLETFKKLKEEAQMNRKEQSIRIGGIEFAIHPTGQKFYAYRLTCKDFLIAFMDKEMPNNAPVHIRFLSSYLWSFGLQDALSNFMEWFSYFSVKVTKNKLSRIDTCVDSDEIRFVQNDVKNVVTRAKCKTEHFVNEEYIEGLVFSGLTVGRGNPLLARIYNKSLEINKSGKVWFHQIWLEHDWDKNNEVWRVEFQIRRPALKELGITSCEDFLQKQNELWSYLTENWLSLRSRTDQNVTRMKVKRKWRLVQQAGMDYQPSPLIRKKIKEGNIQRLLDQAAGLMMSIASVSDHNNIEETTELLNSWFELKLISKDKTFEVEKERRRHEFMNK